MAAWVSHYTALRKILRSEKNRDFESPGDVLQKNKISPLMNTDNTDKSLQQFT
jgi:hypothetical protein